jgi:signal transduction histidine kinase/DNA-binding NarL/FixJ family response regulator
MIKKFHKFFIPEKYWENEEELRRARILVSAMLLSTLFGVFYLFNTIFFQMQHIMYNMVFCIIAFVSLLFLFKYKGSRVLAANIFSALVLLSTAYDVCFSQGLYSWSYDWLAVAPVLAVLFIDKKYGYFWLGATLIIAIIIGIMSVAGFQFPNDVKEQFSGLMTFNAGVGMVVIMFVIVLVLDGAYNNSMMKLAQQKQETEWGRLMAEQEREKAQESERTKQQFLANMSHEIRTPINAMVGLTNILIEKNPSQEQRKYLEVIQKSTDILRVLINDILDLTKLEIGKMQFEQIPFSIKEVTEYIEQSFRHKAEGKGLKLIIEYDIAISPMVIGDPTRLSQILTNLLDNAIKFTSVGHVILSIKKADGNKIKFSVTDTGIGLTKVQEQIIFEPFRQAESGTTRRFGGTGLGLYISKHLVELQKGSFALESEAGKGSTFMFFIEYPVADGTFVPRREVSLTMEEIIHELKGIKILLVEDNEFNRMVAMETLQLKIPGVTIDIAITGKEAVEKAEGHDIIIMDIHMPVMDGYEAARIIRKDMRGTINKVPIIALSASIISSDIEKCMEAGMNGFVPKPFTPVELLTALYNARKGNPFLSPKYIADVTPNDGGLVTNLELLKDSCSNNEEKIKKFISLYLESAPKTLDEIYSLLKKKDYKSLKELVHMFKVHLQYMGMEEAGKLAKQIELYCAGNKAIEEIMPLADRINAYSQKSFVELNAYLNSVKQLA